MCNNKYTVYGLHTYDIERSLFFFSAASAVLSFSIRVRVIMSWFEIFSHIVY